MLVYIKKNVLHKTNYGSLRSQTKCNRIEEQMMKEQNNRQLSDAELKRLAELLTSQQNQTVLQQKDWEKEGEIDLLELAQLLWKKAWAIALAAVIFAGSFLAYTVVFIKPKYTAKTLLYVNSSNISLGSSKVSISASELSAAQSLVDTYIVILNTRTTLDEVIAQSGVPYTYEEMTGSGMIKAAAVNSTEVFAIEVTSTDPREAETIANTIGAVLPNKISSIVEGTSARIVDYAVVPSKKSSPSLSKNTILGFLLGAVLASAAIIANKLMDTKIRDSDYLKQTYNVPILAVIPDLTSSGGKNYSQYAKSDKKKNSRFAKKQTVLTLEESRKYLGSKLNFAAAEAYKLLRTNLGFALPDDGRCRVIGITSSVAGEAKSTTAINTAYTFAQTYGKVLLIEADFRLPNIAKRLKLKQTPGMSNLLIGQCSGNEILQRSDLISSLWVACAGSVPPNPAELIGSERMATTIEALSEIFDVIIIDLPPINVVTDALLLTNVVDGMIHIVRHGYCDKMALDEAISQHRFAGTKLLGFVMTDADTQEKSYYKKQYGGYGHYGSYGSYGSYASSHASQEQE